MNSEKPGRLLGSKNMKKQIRDRTNPDMEEDTMSEAVFEEIFVNGREWGDVRVLGLFS